LIAKPAIEKCDLSPIVSKNKMKSETPQHIQDSIMGESFSSNVLKEQRSSIHDVAPGKVSKPAKPSK
jgi:hypothetical protein